MRTEEKRRLLLSSEINERDAVRYCTQFGNKPLIEKIYDEVLKEVNVGFEESYDVAVSLSENCENQLQDVLGATVYEELDKDDASISKVYEELGLTDQDEIYYQREYGAEDKRGIAQYATEECIRTLIEENLEEMEM